MHVRKSATLKSRDVIPDGRDTSAQKHRWLTNKELNVLKRCCCPQALSQEGDSCFKREAVQTRRPIFLYGRFITYISDMVWLYGPDMFCLDASSQIYFRFSSFAPSVSSHFVGPHLWSDTDFRRELDLPLTQEEAVEPSGIIASWAAEPTGDSSSASARVMRSPRLGVEFVAEPTGESSRVRTGGLQSPRLGVELVAEPTGESSRVRTGELQSPQLAVEFTPGVIDTGVYVPRVRTGELQSPQWAVEFSYSVLDTGVYVFAPPFTCITCHEWITSKDDARKWWGCTFLPDVFFFVSQDDASRSECHQWRREISDGRWVWVNKDKRYYFFEDVMPTFYELPHDDNDNDDDADCEAVLDVRELPGMLECCGTPDEGSSGTHSSIDEARFLTLGDENIRCLIMLYAGGAQLRLTSYIFHPWSELNEQTFRANYFEELVRMKLDVLQAAKQALRLALMSIVGGLMSITDHDSLIVHVEDTLRAVMSVLE